MVARSLLEIGVRQSVSVLKVLQWKATGLVGCWRLKQLRSNARFGLREGEGATITVRDRKMEKLVVFDFDHTLIDCNSDTWVVKKLGAWELMKPLRDSVPWTNLMDRMMTELHNSGRSLLEIEECLRTCPLHPAMLQAVKRAAGSGCELQIVSDANSLFIDTILRAYGIRHLFSEIHTNPSHVDDQGVLRVLPFHGSHEVPHGCQLCPPNMCKGIILDSIRKNASNQTRKQVVYLGDGTGDFCPSLRLEKWDHVLARSGFPLSRLLEGCATVKCKVQHWSSADDAAILLTELLTQSIVAGEDEIANNSEL